MKNIKSIHLIWLLIPVIAIALLVFWPITDPNERLSKDGHTFAITSKPPIKVIETNKIEKLKIYEK